MIGSLRQRHGLPMVTPAAILRRVGRIDFDSSSASFFRFAEQLVKKSRPGGIGNALGKTMIVRHMIDTQIFNGNHVVAIDDLSAFLMGEIVSSEGDPFVHACHGLAVLASLRGAFGKLAMLALYLCQRLFFFAEKARIGYLFSIAEGSKRRKSDVNTNLGGHIRQAFRFALTRETDVPLAGRGTVHGTRFDPPLHRTVIDHLDATNLGKRHTVIMRDAKATLRKSEGVISVLALETREADFFCMFSDAAEEGFESQVNTNSHILQDLRMHATQRWAFLFQYRKRIDLLIERETLTRLLIGILPFPQQVIIEPTALFKSLIELPFLLFRWVNPIAEHFMHTQILAQSRTYVKQGAALSSPSLKAKGFSRADFIKSLIEIE